MVIEHRGQTLTLPNDAVIIGIGDVLPTAFLKSIGVAVQTRYGETKGPALCATTERLA